MESWRVWTSSASMPRAARAATTLFILAALASLAAGPVAAIDDTPTVKRAWSGRLSARPVAEMESSVSSLARPGRSPPQAPSARAVSRTGADLTRAS